MTNSAGLGFVVGPNDARKISRNNGTPTVGLGIMKLRGANTVAVGEAVLKKTEQLRKALPPGYAIRVAYDGTQFVAIASGGVSIQTTSANGDTIWAFSLKGSPGDRLKPFAPPPAPENVVGFSGSVVKANTVKIDDYTYGPARITIAAGTKVTFTNAGSQPHNANSSDAGGWDTGLLAKGESAAVTFNRPGTYTYVDDVRRSQLLPVRRCVQLHFSVCPGTTWLCLEPRGCQSGHQQHVAWHGWTGRGPEGHRQHYLV